MKKKGNIQPWLDFFDLLYTYEREGFLEVLADKHEAYVTRAALHTLGGEAAEEQLLANVPATARRIRAYAAFRSRSGAGYLVRPFALHVVKDEKPHDLLCTLLLSRRRRWWKLWLASDCIEVIDYTGK